MREEEEQISRIEAFLDEGLNFEKNLSLLKDNKRYSLEYIAKFLDILGHPEKKWRVFHVAGSKGKGTVSYTLVKLLPAKTGLIVSPYV